MNLKVQGQVVKWNLDRVTLCGILFSCDETVLPDGVHMEKPYEGTWHFSSIEKFLIIKCRRVFVLADYSGEPSEVREELNKFCDISIPIIVKLENKEYLLGNEVLFQSFYDTLSAELLRENPQALYVMEEFGNSNCGKYGNFKLSIDRTDCADIVFDGGSSFSSFKTLIPLEQLQRKMSDGEPLKVSMPDGKVEELPKSDMNLLGYLRQYGKVVIVPNKPNDNLFRLLRLVFDGWKFYA